MKTGSWLLAGILSVAVLGWIAVAAAGPASAQATPPARTPAPANAQAYFIDLADGARIPPQVRVRFGLVNMGVAPAGVTFRESGHHHLLIDVPLPPLDQPIPADDNHLHFGRGQTETTLTLSPGPHTLQLLLGDQDHVPHDPPVYSPVIHVTVVQPRTPAPADAEVYFISPADGDVIPATSTIRFGLRGMGVAPTSVNRARTGHHHLVIDAEQPDLDGEIPADDNHLHFGKGATETEITLTPGRHTLQLVFADRRHMNFDPPVLSKRITVTVRGPAGG